MSDAKEIAELVRQGKKIEAIKLLREASGMSLKETKDFIERDASPEALEAVIRHAARPATIGRDDDVRRLAAAGQVIEAIKLLRQQTGLGLKEAKAAVDAMRPPKPSKSTGQVGESPPLKWLLAAAVAAALCAALYALGIRP